MLNIMNCDFEGLMGEANLRCARGETDDAIKLCMEVIRQVRYLFSISYYRITIENMTFSRPLRLPNLFRR